MVDLDRLIQEASTALGSSVVGVARMHGGMSAQLFALELADERRVVARFPNAEFHQDTRDPVDHELRVLQAVQGVDVPCPVPLGRGRDFLLMSHLPGRATARAERPELFVSEMARVLAAIHRTPTEGLNDLKRTTWFSGPDWRPLNDDLREPEVCRAVDRGMPEAPFVLRHGDFWPGNFLWEDDRISGVVDWEEAQLGPAIADLAVSRLDVRWILGPQWQEAFTECYLAESPLDTRDLAFWDLQAALRPMGNLEEWVGPYKSLERSDIDGQDMRRDLLAFVDEALRSVDRP